MRENPDVPGDPELLSLVRRTQNHRGALVNHVVGVHQLRVRPADHPVVRAGLGDLFCRALHATPSMRIGCCHPAEVRPQRSNPDLMALHGFPVGDSKRLLEKWVDKRWWYQSDTIFGRPRHRNVLGPGRDRNGIGLLGPIRANSIGPQPHPGTPGFSAGDKYGIGPTLLNIQAGAVEERLRGVSTDPAVGRARLRCPDPPGE